MPLLNQTIQQISPQDQSWRRRAKQRLDQLIMPHWALGRLMDLAVDLAGITRSMQPPVARKAIVTMAGDHGVAAEGVSRYPQEVTGQMVHGFVGGLAGINVLARLAGAKVVVVDMGVSADLGPLAASGKIVSRRIAPGTSNIAAGPAMTREQAVRAVEAGIEVAQEMADSCDVFGTGDMGIANTTPSTAVLAALTGTPVPDVTGRGTGIDDGQLARKVAVVQAALQVNRPDPRDGLDVLSKVGGFEIGGIAGLVLGAAACRKPIVVDGFISTASAIIARSLCPMVSDYLIAAHRSVEQGHRLMHQFLGKEPLLDLNLRLGEGTGAALAMNLVEAAQRILTEMATFDEAHVSSRVMKPFLAAVRFLTVVPVPGTWGTAEADLARSVPFFPVIGLVLGCVAAGLAWVLALAARAVVTAAAAGGRADELFGYLPGRAFRYRRRLFEFADPGADPGDSPRQPRGRDGNGCGGLGAVDEVCRAGFFEAVTGLGGGLAHAVVRTVCNGRPHGPIALRPADGAGSGFLPEGDLAGGAVVGGPFGCGCLGCAADGGHDDLGHIDGRCGSYWPRTAFARSEVRPAILLGRSARSWRRQPPWRCRFGRGMR